MGQELTLLEGGLLLHTVEILVESALIEINFWDFFPFQGRMKHSDDNGVISIPAAHYTQNEVNACSFLPQPYGVQQVQNIMYKK